MPNTRTRLVCSKVGHDFTGYNNKQKQVGYQTNNTSNHNYEFSLQTGVIIFQLPRFI